MVIKKQPPAEPINIKTTECDIIIFGIRRTVLKISPHCWKIVGKGMRNLRLARKRKSQPKIKSVSFKRKGD